MKACSEDKVVEQHLIAFVSFTDGQVLCWGELLFLLEETASGYRGPAADPMMGGAGRWYLGGRAREFVRHLYNFLLKYKKKKLFSLREFLSAQGSTDLPKHLTLD